MLKADLKDRFREGSLLLLSDDLQTRLTGIRTLEQISKESDEHYWHVMDLLTAYIKRNASYEPRYAGRGTLIGRDIETVLSVIARRSHYYGNGESAPLNLEEAILQGSSALKASHLEGSNLYRADLSGADLRGTNLRGTNL